MCVFSGRELVNTACRAAFTGDWAKEGKHKNATTKDCCPYKRAQQAMETATIVVWKRAAWQLGDLTANSWANVTIAHRGDPRLRDSEAAAE